MPFGHKYMFCFAKSLECGLARLYETAEGCSKRLRVSLSFRRFLSLFLATKEKETFKYNNLNNLYYTNIEYTKIYKSKEARKISEPLLICLNI